MGGRLQPLRAGHQTPDMQEMSLRGRAGDGGHFFPGKGEIPVDLPLAFHEGEVLPAGFARRGGLRPRKNLDRILIRERELVAQGSEAHQALASQKRPLETDDFRLNIADGRRHPGAGECFAAYLRLPDENGRETALLVELVVSWTVWSHHLLSDQAQPGILKVASGEMVTAFELITQGLAFFITLATLWSARPLKMTMPLRFLLGGLLGFALAVPAGIMQADIGLNRILHNTQWVVGPHVHVAVLVGLTMTLYSAIYLLLPILTNGARLYSEKLAHFHFWAQLLGGIGMGAFMGMAGLQGMLRRTIYTDGEFMPYMVLAGLSGLLLLLGFLAFFYNIVMSLGLKGVVGIFSRSRVETAAPVAAV